MDGNAKTPNWRDAEPQGKRTDRADQSQPQYKNKTALVQDCQRLEREVQHFRSVTPEPRVCVYGIPSSVPFSRSWKGGR